MTALALIAVALLAAAIVLILSLISLRDRLTYTEQERDQARRQLSTYRRVREDWIWPQR